jgi:2-phosphosulfolactate phosphatase
MAFDNGARGLVLVEVALAPHLLPSEPDQRARTVFVVVDVIRATTSICVLLERGCRHLRVAETVANALALAQPDSTDSAPRLVLAGEVGGLPPDGFDYGNSPTAFAEGHFSAAEVVLATTNGTRALFACAGGAAILVGALRNASAVARAAGERARAGIADGSGAPWTIMLVCAGVNDQPAPDDTICAGVIIGAVLAELRAAGPEVVIEDRAHNALTAGQLAVARGLQESLAETGAARAIADVGLAADLRWCAALNASAVVPHVAGADPAHHLLRIAPWASTTPE